MPELAGRITFGAATGISSNMASSYACQIPVIVDVLVRLAPKRVLDVGKGFGKYGFLIHEYLGVPTSIAPDPAKPLREQSNVRITGIDINPRYGFPHLGQFYDRIDQVDILAQFRDYRDYDVVLICDVIEHLPKEPASEMVHWFFENNKHVLISTPNTFFDQEIYQSHAEHHVSHWRPRDFRALGCHLDWQRVGPGSIFLLSKQPVNVRGFGRGWINRLRRMAGCLRDQLLPR